MQEQWQKNKKLLIQALAAMVVFLIVSNIARSIRADHESDLVRHREDAQILAQVYLAMTGGQSSLFQEVTNTESNQTDPSLIKKVKENRDKIKVIYANKNELEAHKNYFQN